MPLLLYTTIYVFTTTSPFFNNLPQSPLEYKFLVWDNDSRQPLYWESDENRILSLVPQKQGETVVISGLYFRDSLPLWRCAGSVIPVFSLRSEKSFGVGDLGDLPILGWIPIRIALFLFMPYIPCMWIYRLWGP